MFQQITPFMVKYPARPLRRGLLLLKKTRKIIHIEPVAKVGYFCTGSCSFSGKALRNVHF
jgi:hypothetical protein